MRLPDAYAGINGSDCPPGGEAGTQQPHPRDTFDNKERKAPPKRRSARSESGVVTRKPT